MKKKWLCFGMYRKWCDKQNGFYAIGESSNAIFQTNNALTLNKIDTSI